ncbi:hypothetical protein FB2170_12871 [Maribacter sp. HTCC2170]|nr:hypothetical protein FB2170_12871 [Maribacter sp. HTCC2170]
MFASFHNKKGGLHNNIVISKLLYFNFEEQIASQSLPFTYLKLWAIF